MARDRKSDAHMKVLKVAPGEVRHHDNEDKTDNTKANLKPMTRGEHTAHHNRTRGLGKLRKALAMVKNKERLY